jgi:thioredoxin reductase (NADPH)
MKEYPVIIIGAGPAGLSCALYLKRAGVLPLVLEKSAPGGKLLTIAEIANYPGFAPTNGFTLAQALLSSAEAQGVQITAGEVVSVAHVESMFQVATREETLLTPVLVVASGLANVPSIPGEKDHINKGVSYCATCDGPLYRKKDVALFGSGEKAFEEASYLAGLVHHLYFLSPNALNEISPLAEELFSLPNVEKIVDVKITQVLGEGHVEKIVYEAQGEPHELAVSALFPLAGEKSASAFLSSLNVTLDHGFVITDEKMMSSCAGLFAIGDIVKKNLRQVVTACSDGAVASQSILAYRRSLGLK